MKIVTKGFTKLDHNCLSNLEEPIPYKISTAIFKKCIIIDDSETLRKCLREIYLVSKSSQNQSLRTLVEMILGATRSSNHNAPVGLDLSNSSPIDLETAILGEETSNFFKSLHYPVVPGVTRDEVFEKKIAPFSSTAFHITIYDRYMGPLLLGDNSLNSGAFWFIKKLIETGVNSLRIITSSQNGLSKYSKTDFERILHWKELGLGAIKCRIDVGFINHDRHLRFSYPISNREIVLALGKGAEIFRDKSLREGFVITEVSSETALANENSIKERNVNSSFFVQTKV